MALNVGKHLFGELPDGTKVTFVEKKIEKEKRNEYQKKFYSKYKLCIEKNDIF